MKFTKMKDSRDLVWGERFELEPGGTKGRRFVGSTPDCESVMIYVFNRGACTCPHTHVYVEAPVPETFGELEVGDKLLYGGPDTPPGIRDEEVIFTDEHGILVKDGDNDMCVFRPTDRLVEYNRVLRGDV